MTIGIIAAMSEELEILLKDMNLSSKVYKANMEFNYGTIFGNKVVAVVCGIGKVNSAICAQILITYYNVDKIINVGIAGGIGEDIYPGDIVIGDSLVQHDVDTTMFGDRIGQIPRLDTFDFKCDKGLVNLAHESSKEITNHKTFIGRIVSGDQFIADTKKILWLKEEFGALACEMEGASIAHVCYLNSIPFVVIRSISDNANNGAQMDYEKFKLVAVENSTNMLKQIIKAL